MVGLLDVNVLVALAWPTHVHHDRAQGWLGRRAGRGWATCPATQAGFARVISNPAFSPDALTPGDAFSHLRKMLARPGHVFWTDDRPLVDSRWLAAEKVMGYRQVTDAHLLAVALRHKGALVTLDRGAQALVPAGFPRGAVQVLLDD
jgi:toxin-antitoxin system PIN domain toxin